MKHTYVIQKCIYPAHIKDLCIQKNLYTKGTNLEYEEMLQVLRDEDNKFRYDITDQDIIALAENIVEHSEINGTEEEKITYVVFELFKLVNTFVYFK